MLDRQVVDEVLKFEEEGLFLRGLVHWVGYATASVPFECGERHAGTSKYGLRKMLTLGWHGVSSFSLVPLRIGIAVGLLSSTLAFLGTGYAIVGWWVDDAIVPGWASSVAMTSFLFGVLFVVSRRARRVRRAHRRRGAPQAALSRARDDAADARRPPTGARNGAAPPRTLARKVEPTRAGVRLAASVCALRRRRLCELRRELRGVLRVVSVLAARRVERPRRRRERARLLRGLVNSFVLNRLWTFRAEGHVAAHALKFGVLNAATLAGARPSCCCSWTERACRRSPFGCL